VWLLKRSLKVSDLMMPRETRPPTVAQRNIETIARMEQDFLESRTFVDRLGDGIADFAGSMKFFLLHVAMLIAWIAVNGGVIPGIPAFDPFPYVLLTMIVSLESVLLSTFVLIKQNRMTKRADHRDHLNLQIDLLSEKEITKMLQLQRLMCSHMGIKEAERDGEALEMSEHTAVDTLARELRTRLPNE
jgi:uncharacterized membrane protein